MGWGRGDKKRTTVVRGYRELHNSWPPHNRAAQGCERADGMSFSFVSSRGDYFSFHSFISCRDSSRSSLPSPLSLSLFSFLFALLSPSVFLAPFLSQRRAGPSLSHGPFFRSRGPVRPGLILERRVIKLLFYAMRARNYERKGRPDGARFVNAERERERADFRRNARADRN